MSAPFCPDARVSCRARADSGIFSRSQRAGRSGHRFSRYPFGRSQRTVRTRFHPVDRPTGILSARIAHIRKFVESGLVGGPPDHSSWVGVTRACIRRADAFVAVWRASCDGIFRHQGRGCEVASTGGDASKKTTRSGDGLYGGLCVLVSGDGGRTGRAGRFSQPPGIDVGRQVPTALGGAVGAHSLSRVNERYASSAHQNCVPFCCARADVSVAGCCRAWGCTSVACCLEPVGKLRRGRRDTSARCIL